MSPTESNRAGSTVRVFRVQGPGGTRLILEQSGRHFDLSHGLGHTRRGDLLDLITRGSFDQPKNLLDACQHRPTLAPMEVLTPFEPRHVGKILAIAHAPRELFELSATGDARGLFSNRSPASLVADGAEISLVADVTEARELRPADGGLLLHEVFLAAVIARRATGLEVADAEACISGFMVASDFTRRTLDGRPRTPWFGQSPVGVLAIGPAFVPRACFELGDVTIRARRRLGAGAEPQIVRRSAEFKHDIALAVAALSRLAILHPGDLVLIPTGLALGAVEGGDEVHCSIEGIGELRVRVPRRARLRQQA